MFEFIFFNKNVLRSALNSQKQELPTLPRRRKLNITKGKVLNSEMALGSDFKSKTPIINRCVLCLQKKQLQLSHVTPRWMYKGLKEEGGIVGSYKSIGIETKEHDGRKHYLLCEKCEQFLSVAEAYASDLMVGSDEILKNKKITISDSFVFGLNEELIQRFLLGIILKAHYSPSPPYHHIKIQPDALECIRKTILSKNFRDKDFPILGCRFFSKIEKNIKTRGMLSLFSNSSSGGNFFELLGSNWSWMIFLNIDRKLEDFFYQRRLRKNVSFFAPMDDIVVHRSINPSLYGSRKERRIAERKLKKDKAKINKQNH